MIELFGKSRIGTWSGLFKELLKRSYEPLNHPSFVIYFIVSVVIAGGAGVWLELCSYIIADMELKSPSLSALKTALITFFPAVAGSACLQIIWAEDDHRALRAFATLVLFVLAILALLTGLISVIPIKCALFVGGGASLLSLWIWWIANANQEGLRDKVPTDAPTGGSVGVPLAGDLTGFKV